MMEPSSVATDFRHSNSTSGVVSDYHIAKLSQLLDARSQVKLKGKTSKITLVSI